MFITAKTTNVNDKTRFFRGFSDPSRLKILENLRNGEQTAGAIVERIGLSRSNVSNYLNYLYDCGLVTTERR